jgi:hypothetical protein
MRSAHEISAWVSAATNVHVLPFANRPGARSADH